MKHKLRCIGYNGRTRSGRLKFKNGYATRIFYINPRGADRDKDERIGMNKFHNASHLAKRTTCYSIVSCKYGFGCMANSRHEAIQLFNQEHRKEKELWQK